MAAFPSTALLPKQYINLTTFESGPNGSKTSAYRAIILHAVDAHSSIKRMKVGSPKFLPEAYSIRTVYPGVHTAYAADYSGGKLYWSYTRSTVTSAGYPSSWLWSDPAIQGVDHVPSLNGKLFEKTMDKLKQDTANLSVDAFEAKQTMKLIRDLTNVRRAAERLRKELTVKRSTRSKREYVVVYDNNGNPTKQRRYFTTPGSQGGSNTAAYAKYARDKWMEARFGIRPLVGSIFDTMKALLNNRLSGKYTTRCTSNAKSQSRQVYGAGDGFSPRVTYVIQTDARGMMLSDWKFPENQSVIQSLASLNPVGIAWEVLPLSWMADYFVNVGQTLQNMEDWFRYASSFNGGMTVTTVRETRALTIGGSTFRSPVFWPNGQPMDGMQERRVSGASLCRVTKKSRIVHSSLPSPGGLTTKCNLSVAKVADICSVVSQMLKSR